MGGGRVPGPIGSTSNLDDGFGPGFTDPVPLGGGSGSESGVTLTGWPRQISWNEFEPVASAPAGAKEAAQIDARAIQPTRVSVTKEGGQRKLSGYVVRVKVFKENSWVVTSQKSARLLVHEQGHYDITGLGARDMVADLNAARGSSAKDLEDKVKAIIAAADALMDELTDIYDGPVADGGTAGGTDANAQKSWTDHLDDCRVNGKRLKGPP
jgi:hypothetical protein